jgi:hypothetical protein
MAQRRLPTKKMTQEPRSKALRPKISDIFPQVGTLAVFAKMYYVDLSVRAESGLR